MDLDVSNIKNAKTHIREALKALEKEDGSVQETFFIHSLSLLDDSLRQLGMDEKAYLESFSAESDTEE